MKTLRTNISLVRTAIIIGGIIIPFHIGAG